MRNFETRDGGTALLGERVLDALGLPQEMCGGADWSVWRVWTIGGCTHNGIPGCLYITLDDDEFGVTFRPAPTDADDDDHWDGLYIYAGQPETHEAWQHILFDADHGLAWLLQTMEPSGHWNGKES